MEFAFKRPTGLMTPAHFTGERTAASAAEGRSGEGIGDIEIFYNRQRRQARCGYLPPEACERKYFKERSIGSLVTAIDDRPQY